MLNSIEEAEHYRQEEKRKSRSGDIACILFRDLENKENRKPMEHNGNRLFFPKTTLEEIDYDKIKFKHSVNGSKLKTELVQFYKDGILIKLPAHKKVDHVEIHLQHELFHQKNDTKSPLYDAFFNMLFRSWTSSKTYNGFRTRKTGPQCFFGESFFKGWQSNEYKDFLYIQIEGFNKLLKFSLNELDNYPDVKKVLIKPGITNSEDCIFGMERDFYLQKLHDLSFVIRGDNKQTNNEKTLKIGCTKLFFGLYKKLLAFSMEEILKQDNIKDKPIVESTRKKIKEWQKNPTQGCKDIAEHFFGGHKKQNGKDVLSLINKENATLFFRAIDYCISHKKTDYTGDQGIVLFNLLKDFSKRNLQDLEYLFFDFFKFDSYKNRGYDFVNSGGEDCFAYFFMFFKCLGNVIFLGFKVNNGNQLPCGPSLLHEEMTRTDAFLYWENFPNILLINSKYLEGHQCPLVFEDDKCLNSLPDDEKSKEIKDKIDTVLSEALDNAYGSFTYYNWIEMTGKQKYQMKAEQSDVLKGLKIIETESIMFIFLYDEKERFILEILDKNYKEFVGYLFKPETFKIKNFTQEKFRSFLINKSRELYIFLSSVIRDFKVTKNRDVVLGPVRYRVPTGMKTNRKRIIYLPRIKYNYIEKRKPIDDELKLIRRQPSGGFRSHHIRKLPESYKPSPLQIVLARKQNIEVPLGHTYVRGAVWGQKNMSNDEVIYRSRCMTNTIYFSEEIVSKSEEIVNMSWAGFEEHCRDKISQMGWDATKVRIKDGGIDIEAYQTIVKGQEEKIIRLFVQCKHQKKNIGPDVIIGLLGSKEVEDKEYETQLMVMISGKFSSGAMILANKHNIKLIDGSDLLK
jgi:hypothetical protein